MYRTLIALSTVAALGLFAVPAFAEHGGPSYGGYGGRQAACNVYRTPSYRGHGHGIHSYRGVSSYRQVYVTPGYGGIGYRGVSGHGHRAHHGHHGVSGYRGVSPYGAASRYGYGGIGIQGRNFSLRLGF